MIDYFGDKTAAIESTHQFWLENKDKVRITSNKAEIEAAMREAEKKTWLASIKRLLTNEEEEEQKRLRIDKVEKYIKETPFVGDKAVRGSYVWGDTGSGKTFLCDLFFENLNIKEKRRYHYNKFMLSIHRSNFRYYNVRS